MKSLEAFIETPDKAAKEAERIVDNYASISVAHDRPITQRYLLEKWIANAIRVAVEESHMENLSEVERYKNLWIFGEEKDPISDQCK